MKINYMFTASNWTDILLDIGHIQAGLEINVLEICSVSVTSINVWHNSKLLLYIYILGQLDRLLWTQVTQQCTRCIGGAVDSTFHSTILLPSIPFRMRHSFFIQYSVWWQVQSLLQNDDSTQCDLELPPSNESILSCP